ncbi:hypothetical protein GOV09_04065 [Candidatus Woesearchaeota archaeon]|nr:hypothetical protein [Candidatus Woesearchaeota archaeon]
MSEKVLRTGSLTPTIGDSLESSMARSVYPDGYRPIIDLGSESWNRDSSGFSAECVDDTLVLDDDGAVLDKKELEVFLRRGGDPGFPIRTPGRRVRIDTGIAPRVALEALATEFLIESYGDTTVHIARGSFADPARSHTFKYRTKKNTEGLVGTRITLSGLKHDFEFDQLFSTLQWGFPGQPGFDLYVGDKPVSKRGIIQYCTEFVFDEIVPGVGRVQGSVYYNARLDIQASGLYLYMDGRTVGNPSEFMSALPFRAQNRILGMIDVSKMKDSLGLGGLRFKQDSEAYQSFQDVFRRFLGEISYSIDNLVGSRRYFSDQDRIFPTLKSSLKRAQQAFNTGVGTQRSPASFSFEWEVDDDSKQMARMDGKTIYINAAAPFLTRGGKGGFVDRLITGILYAANDAYVRSEMDGSLEYLDELDNARWRAAQHFFSDTEGIDTAVRLMLSPRQNVAVPVSEVRFDKHRAYSQEEVAYHSGLNVPTVRGMYASGILKGVKRPDAVIVKFLRNDILAALKKVEGYTPLMMHLDPDGYNMRSRTTEGTGAGLHPYEARIAKMKCPSWAKEMGVSQPFQWIKRGHEDKARRHYRRLVVK